MATLQIGPAACRSYLLVCDRSGEAILVDPLEGDEDRVCALLEEKGWKLVLLVDTHVHADHLSAGARLSERLSVPYVLHDSAGCRLTGERIHDGQILEAGDLRVEVLHTPGHTPDSVSLRSGRELLTGDFLFLAQEGAGRLDLPGGDAGSHWDSLQRLSALPDETVVLPGHDYNNLTDSTLEVERRRNPRFQDVTREEYITWQKAVAQETPDWMLDVIAKNLGTAETHAEHHEAEHEPAPANIDLGLDAGAQCGEGAGACASIPTGRVPLISPEDAHHRIWEGFSGERKKPLLLDVREPWEYHPPSGNHAVGAELVPMGAIADSLDDIPREDGVDLMVICRTGGRSAKVAEFLIDQGWRRVFSVAGGTERWAADGLPIEDGTETE
ncbi:MAG: MBL fold metallo-hydrolase [Planctomycetota bacterium]|jgi:glyoxylase-like metal-dependent hydrolase (beta-lactamase superfamily II)/rhodanese-related sulfurtransferase